MDPRHLLAVTHGQALRFFFERLKDVSEDAGAPRGEILYNASVLAHFATTSTASTAHFPGCPSNLKTVFDLFVLDRSQHADPDLMEAAASQCLLLTGFFGAQLKRRHNIEWYAALGAGFYDQAAQLGRDRDRIRMMIVMSARFGFWRRQLGRLAQELRDCPFLVTARSPSEGEAPRVM
jgi:hypothetical protein